MTDSTPVQINIINPAFFFYSHDVRFTESTPSNRVYYAGQASAANNAKGVELTFPLNLLLKELETGYEAIKPIQIKVEQTEGGFIARFVEANVNASGEGWDDAVLNLKSLLIDKLDVLSAHKPNTLGPAPKRQLSVLQSYIRRVVNVNKRARA